jgi:hypothetical protein
MLSRMNIIQWSTTNSWIVNRYSPSNIACKQNIWLLHGSPHWQNACNTSEHRWVNLDSPSGQNYSSTYSIICVEMFFTMHMMQFSIAIFHVLMDFLCTFTLILSYQDLLIKYLKMWKDRLDLVTLAGNICLGIKYTPSGHIYKQIWLFWYIEKWMYVAI